MFKTILVGADGSDTAAVAVDRAAAIAQLTEAELIILFAYRTLPAIGDVGGAAIATLDPERSLEEGKALLRRLKERVGERVGVRTALRQGEPAQSLLDAAKEEGAELIVVGSRGMRGKRRMLGSVPNSVAHRASTDVLIVHTT
jgi:nucleotide-binding universal stress UspA family protein